MQYDENTDFGCNASNAKHMKIAGMTILIHKKNYSMRFDLMSKGLQKSYETIHSFSGDITLISKS
jgi:hypothetical protein